MSKRKILLAALLGLLILLLPVNQTASGQATDCGDAYVVQPGDTLREIAARCGLSEEAILNLNPFIEDRNLIYAGWVLDLTPPAAQVPIPETGAGARSDALYVVKAGDTLAYIARRLEISEDALLAANPNLQGDEDLRTGQILRLSNNISTPSAAVSPQVVEPGQVVTVVAGGFPANTELVIAGGPLGTRGTVLQRAQTGSDGWLRTSVPIPARAERGHRWTMLLYMENNSNVQAVTNLVYVVNTSGPAEPIVYVVRVNDTISAIANRFGVTTEEILPVNPQIENPRVIRVGQEILIPGALMRQQPAEGQAGVFLGPNRGSPGDEVEVFGAGFAADASIDLRVERRNGGRETLASSEVQASQRGTFYTTLTIPSTARQDEVLAIVADPGSEDIAVPPMAQFSVLEPGIPQTGDPIALPTIQLDPANGPAGTIFNVTVTGYPASTPIEMGIGISQASPNIVYAYQTETDGSFFARIQVPQNVQTGQYFIISIAPSQGRADIPALSARFDITQ